MPRKTPDAEDITRMLAAVGLQADQEAVSSLQRRMAFFAQAMDALDGADLGMSGPALAFQADEDGW